MRRHILLSFAFTACLASGVIVSGATAQMPAGDAFEGGLLARGLCADCHVILPDDRTASRQGPPSFQAVADDPAVTALGLEVFLQTPHQTMPDILLSKAERDHLITYILSLR